MSVNIHNVMASGIRFSRVDGEIRTMTFGAAIDGNLTLSVDTEGELDWSRYEGVDRRPLAIATDDQGNCISVITEDGDVIKRDASGSTVWTVPNLAIGAYDAVIDSDGSSYICASSGNVYKVDSSGNSVWTKQPTTGTVRSICIDNGNYVYIGDDTGNIRRINKSNGNTDGTLTSVFGGAVRDLASDQNGNIYGASFDNTVKKIVGSSGSVTWTYSGHTDTVYGVSVDINGNVYSASSDNTVRRINSSGGLVWTFSQHTDAVYDVTIDLDDFVYSASADGTMRKIDSSGDEVWSYDTSGDRIFKVAVTKDTVPFWGL